MLIHYQMFLLTLLPSVLVGCVGTGSRHFLRQNACLISACEKCEQLQQALSFLAKALGFLAELRSISVLLMIITNNAAISACGKCVQWRSFLAPAPYERQTQLPTLSTGAHTSPVHRVG